MSLDSLRRLRRSGMKPQHVHVILGKPAHRCDDTPSHVWINGEPSALDLRPLTGLRISLIDLQQDEELLLRVMDATDEAGALAYGAVSEAGACGVNPEHAEALRKYRERLLCPV
jgi:hypothetical protein